MPKTEHYFRGKKITVMGLGLLGRGVGDAAFLAEQGAELTVTDLKNPDELAPSLERLKGFSNIAYRLSGHALEDFEHQDFILKAAGVPNDSPYLVHARERGVPVKMSASWFAELSGANVIGVTGTRGKSTVTYMLKNILEAADIPFVLGGNVRGVSTLALLKAAVSHPLALMELDSWQLQGWGESNMSPHVAVFTTFFPDHLNYYRGDMRAYLADKAHIFSHQKKGDSFVLGAQAKDAVLGAYRPPVAPRIADAPLIDGWKLQVPGAHNRYNAACAVAAAHLLGIDEEVCKEALAAFKGVSGRLELLGQFQDVFVYNDTTATTPEATLAALNALTEDYGHAVSIILIMGGSDKGLDMSALLPHLTSLKKVIALEGSGTERIKPGLPTTTIYRSSLENAVREAMGAAQPGDVVLFSPAFASFGMFKNEFDRGDRFTALMKTYV